MLVLGSNFFLNKKGHIGDLSHRKPQYITQQLLSLNTPSELNVDVRAVEFKPINNTLVTDPTVHRRQWA
jgi:hypothetical protein